MPSSLRRRAVPLVGITDISVPVLGHKGNAIAVLTCLYIQRVQNADNACEQFDVNSTSDLLIEVAEKLSVW